jgi:hypothetical protein
MKRELKPAVMAPFIGACVLTAFAAGTFVRLVPNDAQSLLFLAAIGLSFTAMVIHAKEVQ